MLQPERVLKFLSEDSTVRISSTVATRLVNEMRKTLETYPIATVALGRAMIGCALMASHLKQEHSVGVYFRGSGPIGTLFAEASYEGMVRAYTANPKLELPLSPDGLLDIKGAVGHGLLEVVRASPFLNDNRNHTGTVIIRTGEIGDDLAYYLEQSHQIPSVVALSVQLDRYGQVEGAGGVLIEVMPGASEEALANIERQTKKVASLSKLILDGAGPEDLAKAFLSETKLQILEHPSELKYHCKCSLERIGRSFMLLGTAELDDMIREAKPIDVTCEFCGRRYQVGLDQLETFRRESHKNSLH